MEKPEMNLFELASRQKFRFPFRGDSTVEDLWDMSLEALDSIFKQLNAQSKVSAEESLLTTRSKADEELSMKIDLIKYVVATKQQEAADRVNLRKRLAERQKLLGLKAEAEDAALRSKTPEELQAMIDALG